MTAKYCSVKKVDHRAWKHLVRLAVPGLKTKTTPSVSTRLLDQSMDPVYSFLTITIPSYDSRLWWRLHILTIVRHKSKQSWDYGTMGKWDYTAYSVFPDYKTSGCYSYNVIFILVSAEAPGEDDHCQCPISSLICTHDWPHPLPTPPPQSQLLHLCFHTLSLLAHLQRDRARCHRHLTTPTKHEINKNKTNTEQQQKQKVLTHTKRLSWAYWYFL